MVEETTQAQLCVWMAGRALEQQSGGMAAQSVVARNYGYRGWLHEGAVTMAPKEEKESAYGVSGRRDGRCEEWRERAARAGGREQAASAGA